MKRLIAKLADWVIQEFCHKEWIELQEKRKIRNLMFYGISIEKVFTKAETISNKISRKNGS